MNATNSDLLEENKNLTSKVYASLSRSKITRKKEIFLMDSAKESVELYKTTYST